MAFFSFATQPRARFVQTMTLNIIGVCLSAAVMLLSIYCAVKARERSDTAVQHALPNTNPEVSYNSSASADGVSGASSSGKQEMPRNSTAVRRATTFKCWSWRRHPLSPDSTG